MNRLDGGLAGRLGRLDRGLGFGLIRLCGQDLCLPRLAARFLGCHLRVGFGRTGFGRLLNFSRLWLSEGGAGFGLDAVPIMRLQLPVTGRDMLQARIQQHELYNRESMSCSDGAAILPNACDDELLTFRKSRLSHWGRRVDRSVGRCDSVELANEQGSNCNELSEAHDELVFGM